jgi:hypothetical protein
MVRTRDWLNSEPAEVRHAPPPAAYLLRAVFALSFLLALPAAWLWREFTRA